MGRRLTCGIMGLHGSAAVATALASTFATALAAALAAGVVLTGCTPKEAVSPAPSQASAQESAPASAQTQTQAPSQTLSETSRASSRSAPRVPEPAGDVGAGLDLPWAVAVLPDGTALVTERDTARVMQVGGGPPREVGSIPEALAGSGEGGLLGLAASPDYAQDSLLFAYYTGEEDNRIVRMSYADGVLGKPEPILTGIPKSRNHNGGRIKFGPDGNLYVGTGDAQRPELAQDRGSLAGKILRITADGQPAEGNPDPGSPVYSLGHRNVQGLAWDSAGRLWATEFGPDVNDELNLITPGGNYGWPDVTGAPGTGSFRDAKVVWPSTATSSPSGIAIVDDVAYIGALRGERLWQVDLHGGKPGTPRAWFEGTFGRLRDVVAGPDGTLWVAANAPSQGAVLRVELK